jgi:hypothetical protein
LSWRAARPPRPQRPENLSRRIPIRGYLLGLRARLRAIISAESLVSLVVAAASFGLLYVLSGGHVNLTESLLIPVLAWLATLNLLYVFRADEGVVVPSLDASAGFTSAILNSEMNFCAVSSKELALWASPTFLFYLFVNDVQSLLGYRERHGKPLTKLSSSQEDRQAFIEESKLLLSHVSRGKRLRKNALRLLIYPRSVYRERFALISALIQSHAVARVHCVPIISELLLDRLTPAQKDRLTTLEHQLTSGRKFDSEAPAIPDFLVIDNWTPTLRTSNVWWYEAEEVQKNPNLVEIARDVFRILCDAAQSGDAIWEEFTADLVKFVAASDGPPGAGGGFYSASYFQEWLNLPQQGFQELHQWLDAETRAIVERVGGRGVVLDVGCGFGRHLKLLLEIKPDLVGYGIDSNPDMVAAASQNLLFDNKLMARVSSIS